MIGGALQAATQSADFILVARVVTGLGTGALTAITPVLVAETSRAEHRGGFLGYVFIANYLGISVGKSFILRGSQRLYMDNADNSEQLTGSPSASRSTKTVFLL